MLHRFIVSRLCVYACTHRLCTSSLSVAISDLTAAIFVSMSTRVSCSRALCSMGGAGIASICCSSDCASEYLAVSSLIGIHQSVTESDRIINTNLNCFFSSRFFAFTTFAIVCRVGESV